MLIFSNFTITEGQKNISPHTHAHRAKVVDRYKHYATAGKWAGENKMSTSNMTLTNASRVDT